MKSSYSTLWLKDRQSFTTSYGGTANYNLDNMYSFEDTVDYGPNFVDWRSRLRAGIDCTTTAVGYKRTAHGGPTKLFASYSDQFNNGYVDLYEGQIGNTIDPNFDPGVFSDQLYNQALSRFVSKARAVQLQFQAGVFLGELKETIDLLRHPYTLFAKLTKSYHKTVKRRLSRTKKHNVKKVLAEEWLAYSFGVKPLLMDIDDVMHDLAGLTYGRPKTTPISVNLRERTVSGSSESGTPLTMWTKAVFLSTIKDESITIRGSVRCVLPSVLTPDSKPLKVAMSEFIPTVWELIPWSFLSDYFVNIGDILSALTFLDSTVEWCNYTKRQTVTKEGIFVFYPKPVSTNITILERSTGRPSEAKATVTKWQRDRITSFVPSLSFSLKSFTKWTRDLNMVALLAQARR